MFVTTDYTVIIVFICDLQWEIYKANSLKFFLYGILLKQVRLLNTLCC
jgi:hypothetical protein